MDFFLVWIVIISLGVLVAKLQTRVTRLEEKLRGTNILPQNTSPKQISPDDMPFGAVPLQTVPIPEPETIVQPLQGNIQSEHIASENKRLQNDFIDQMPQPVEPFVTPTSSVANPIMVWLSHNTLIKVGSLLFFFGAVWFVSYAISQGWINPFMRIFIGIVLGIGVCALGMWRKKSDSEQYLTLTTLGVGIVIASIFAGQFLFNLFSPLFAFFLLVCTIGYAVAISLDAKKEWLCVLSAVASLFVPLLVHAPKLDSTLFLTYFLIISVAFLAVVFKTNWRWVTLILALGTGFFLFLVYIQNVINMDVLWIFVILFSALFYGASSVSMFRNNDVQTIDLLSFAAVVIPFISWTHNLVAPDGLVTFIAAAITAVTGYFLYVNQRSEKLIALYVSLSGVLILIATAFTFDGYALTMVYTLEIGSVLMLSMYLRLRSSVVKVLSWTFLIPVTLSLEEFSAPEWSTGIWHSPGVTLYAILVTTCIVGVFAIERSRRIGELLYQSIGGIFILLFWFYAYLCIWLVSGALFIGADAIASQYVLWATTSSFIIVYLYALKLPSSWVSLTLVSFIFPVFLSFGSFTDFQWETSWFHASALGLYFMTILSLCHGLWFTDRAIQMQDKKLFSIGGGWLTLFVFYAFFVVFLFWGAIYGNEAIANVSRYISWTILICALAYGARSFRVPSSWLTAVLVMLVIPIMASFASFSNSLWKTSWTHLDAAGLYVLVFLFMFIVLTLQRGRDVYSGNPALLTKCIQSLWILIGTYLVTLTWLISHAVFTSSDVAISVALFVYTVSGLILYTVGKSLKEKGIRYAGITLLGIVVGRLLIIDVWEMEVIGRIVTFLGIGLLFILTALFEKPFEKIGKTNADIPPNIT